MSLSKLASEPVEPHGIRLTQYVQCQHFQSSVAPALSRVAIGAYAGGFDSGGRPNVLANSNSVGALVRSPRCEVLPCQ